MLLPKKFYNRPTIKVAQDLLGCFLVRKIAPLQKSLSSVGCGMGQGVNNTPLIKGVGGIFKYKIVETEAYVGPNDLASHASRGRTERNSVMFGEPGIIYVYFTYGMHYMLNIVTEKKEYPAAVLIRAVEPINGRGAPRRASTNGPAKLTKTLKIDKTFNHLPIYTKKHGLWIEGRVGANGCSPLQIVKTTRIGIDYAGEHKHKKWRFYIKDNKFVSKLH